MPAGKGTYGSKRGRPPRRATTTPYRKPSNKTGSSGAKKPTPLRPARKKKR